MRTPLVLTATQGFDIYLDAGKSAPFFVDHTDDNDYDYASDLAQLYAEEHAKRIGVKTTGAVFTTSGGTLVVYFALPTKEV